MTNFGKLADVVELLPPTLREFNSDQPRNDAAKWSGGRGDTGDVKALNDGELHQLPSGHTVDNQNANGKGVYTVKDPNGAMIWRGDYDNNQAGAPTQSQRAGQAVSAARKHAEATTAWSPDGSSS
jgi:hypothetical protein